MTFTEKELEQIEQMASLYLSVTDIATVLDKRPEELRREIRTKDSPAARAYQKGKTMRKVQLRKQKSSWHRWAHRSPWRMPAWRSSIWKMTNKC